MASGPRRTDTGSPAIFIPWNASGTGGMTCSGPASPNGTTGSVQRLRQVGHPGAEPHGRVVGELRLGRGVGALREDQDAPAAGLSRAHERAQAHLTSPVLVDRVQPERQDAVPGEQPGEARLAALAVIRLAKQPSAPDRARA